VVRILWHSAHPFVPGGFSKATRELTRRIAKLGHEVMIYAYGRNETYFVWEPEDGVKIPVLPSGAHPLGDDAWRIHLERRKADLMVSLCDVWLLDDIPRSCSKWVPYVPLDHSPPSDLLVIKVSNALGVLAMTRWAQEELADKGIEADYLPHGVNTQAFRPLSEELRSKVRKQLGIPEDAFVFLCVGLNVGFRKEFPRLFRAFKMLLDQLNPSDEVWLYIHANTFPPSGQPGYHLEALAGFLEVWHRVLLTDMYRWWIGLEEDEMALLYNACDVFVLPSRGEGFCLPLLEAQACGLPCITTDFGAMRELVKGYGWLIRVKDWDVTPLCAYQALADVEHLADLMYRAYTHDSEREKYGKACTEFAKQYDWGLVVENYAKPFLDKVETDIRESRETRVRVYHADETKAQRCLRNRGEAARRQG